MKICPKICKMIVSWLSFPDIHLTNVAVQKTAPDYDPEKGSKWSVQQLRMYLIAKHGQKNVHYFLLYETVPLVGLGRVPHPFNQ